VCRAIERLEKYGLLIVGKRGRGNLYRLGFGPVDFDPKVLQRRNQRAASSQQKRCEPAALTSENTSTNLVAGVVDNESGAAQGQPIDKLSD
jgi:hypothetical protein